LARPDGFEPPTTAFEAQCSIQLSYGRNRREVYRVYQGAARMVAYRATSASTESTFTMDERIVGRVKRLFRIKARPAA
jgi:hypothetical protein